MIRKNLSSIGRVMALVLLVSIGTIQIFGGPQSTTPDAPAKTTSPDFDFLYGNWKITNRILKERLNNSNEWRESIAYSRCWKILDGWGNMDEFTMESRDGRVFKGNTIRIFNPENKEWIIYWADTWNPELGMTQQTTGTFKNGIGTFFGEDLHQGKKVRQKFTWKRVDANTAYWDQAYFDESKNDWEVNWIMNFERVIE